MKLVAVGADGAILNDEEEAAAVRSGRGTPELVMKRGAPRGDIGEI